MIQPTIPTDMTFNGKVALVNLNPGEVRVEFLQSLLDTMIGDINSRRVLSHIRPVIAGPLLDIYRNRAVEWFIKESDAEWMLFIDSDVVWKLEDLYKLLDSADPIHAPVVSGTYLMILPEGCRPSLFHTNTTGTMDVWPDNTPLPPNQLIDVDGCGAGFLLMHRSILIAMFNVYGAPMPWFANEIVNGVVHGEDFTFCKRVQELGCRVYVHTGVQLDHIKHTTLRLDDEKWNPQLVATPNISTEPNLTNTTLKGATTDDAA